MLISSGVIAGALLSGCAAEPGSSGQAADTAATGSSTSVTSGDQVGEAASLSGQTLALVTCTDANPWCKLFNQAIKARIESLGGKVTILRDEFDPAQLSANVDQAISQQPDLIAVLASDANAVVPALARAQGAGIKVAAVEGPASDEGASMLATQVLAGNEHLGRFAAQNLVEGMRAAGHDSGNVIAITGTASMLNVQMRMDGFKDELAKTPEYTLVAEEDGNWDQVKTAAIAQQLFAKYQGDVQGAYGMADYMAVGIAQAAEQADMPVGVDNRGLVITGSNCFKVGIDSIKSGELYGTATQTPVEEGELVATVLSQVLAGQDVDPLYVATESRITRDNVDEFADRCNL